MCINTRVYRPTTSHPSHPSHPSHLAPPCTLSTWQYCRLVDPQHRMCCTHGQHPSSTSHDVFPGWRTFDPSERRTRTFSRTRPNSKRAYGSSIPHCPSQRLRSPPRARMSFGGGSGCHYRLPSSCAAGASTPRRLSHLSRRVCRVYSICRNLHTLRAESSEQSLHTPESHT